MYLFFLREKESRCIEDPQRENPKRVSYVYVIVSVPILIVFIFVVHFVVQWFCIQKEIQLHNFLFTLSSRDESHLVLTKKQTNCYNNSFWTHKAAPAFAGGTPVGSFANYYRRKPWIDNTYYLISLSGFYYISNGNRRSRLNYAKYL